MEKKLEFIHVTKKYGEKQALSDFTVVLEPGIYGLLGPNGAGKSTLMNLLTDNIRRTSGEILYNGEEILKSGAKFRSKIGYMPQQQGMYEQFSGERFLYYIAALKGMKKRDAAQQIEKYLELVGLKKDSKRRVGGYSGGMRQRLMFVAALLGDPEILILDEPTAGLDPKERARFRNILSTLSKDRIVILSTHIVSDIESNANQVILLKERKLYRMDTVSNICKTLDGKVYECVMEDRAFDAFQDTHLILSVRQEQEHMQVRYYSSKPEEGSRNCTPNLEDVFLVTYQEEPA